MINQKQIWNKIAPEWYLFKQIPAKHTLEFLRKQQGQVLDLGSGAARHLVKIKNGKMYEVDFSLVSFYICLTSILLIMKILMRLTTVSRYSRLIVSKFQFT